MHLQRHFHTARARLALMTGLALLTAGTTAPAQAGGADTYIALGDSYAYGFTTVANVTDPSLGKNNYFGLQGYVQPFSQFLGAQQTINLALPGETVASFTAGGNDNADANLNYAPGFADSQAALLAKTLAAETAQGHTISDVTIQLGGNDLLGAIFNDPTFQTGSFADKQALVTGQLTTISTQYGALLQSLRTNPALAGTQVSVIGYFDPFADLGAGDPFGLDPLGHQLSGDLDQALNATLAADASAAGFHFVDPYAAFQDYPGSHAGLSYINSPLDDPNYPASTPNFHPTPLGYGLLAEQIEAAPVPEASTAISFFLLLAWGVGGVIVAKRSKRSL